MGKFDNNYYKQREIKCLDKIEEICKELPSSVYDFIYGITDYTSPLTRLNYCLDLRIFFDYLSKTIYRGKEKSTINLEDLDALDSPTFINFLAYLSHYDINGKEEICNERTKSRKLSTVRAFYKYLYNMGYIKSNAPSKVALPKLHEQEIIRLDLSEMKNLLFLADNGEQLTNRQKSYHKNTKIRDFAILSMFLGTGIRNSELVGLNVDDINFKDNSFSVTRKGGKRMILYFNEEVANALKEWIEYRNSIEELPETEKALFVSLQNKRITTRAIEQLVKKYSQIVTPLKHITPHKLRSTFGTNLYRQTNDIYVVAHILGHNDVNTTKKHYAATGDDIMKKAINGVKLTDDNE